ncbi:ATP-binding protein [Natronosalvus rutilus]|uniref:histidine kinase n=1 Tax=Natronosalvus rutilus TaxID=2953753 RepID=A0A9E7SUZ8_9EURY|nr:ATP-binding protein [Natronosalvus rutilus]
MRTRGADSSVVLFFGLSLGAFLWTGFSALKLLHTDPDVKLLFYQLLHVGVALVSPLLFLFALACTDRHRWLRWDVVAGVIAIPTLFVVLLFVGPDDAVIAGVNVMEGDLTLVRVEDGPVFYVFSLYTLALTVAAIVVIGLEARRVGPSYYQQAGLLTVGAASPLVFAVLSKSAVPPFGSDTINLVPVSGAIAATAFAIAIFSYRLFSLPPLAYATVIKYSPDGTFVLDADGQIVHVNERGRTLLEHLGGDFGSPLASLLPSFDLETLTGEDEPIPIDVDGEVRYVRPLAEPLERGNRRVGWVVVLRDVTESQHSRRQLETQYEQMDAFAATVSHDLRNPLAVAQGYLELAREDADSEALENVAIAHSRMESIVTDILALARRGDRVGERAEISLGSVLDTAWSAVDTKQATLAVETDRTIYADPTTVQHVFENLLRNAIEHGGPEVEITVGDFDGGIFVEDTGTGIPDTEREAIFDPGYTTSPDGTGYGLELVRTIVDAHGWTLALADGSTEGARFEITGLSAEREC